MSTPWFGAKRQRFIRSALDVYGYINTAHLQRMFGISRKIAQTDLGVFLKVNPKAMHYDVKLKCYVNSERRLTIRNHITAKLALRDRNR